MVAAPRWLPTTGWDGDGDRGGREHPQPTALLPLRLSLLRQKERGGYVGENGLSKPLRTPAARAPVPPYGRSAAVGSPPSFSAVTQPGDAASAAEIQRTPLRSATRVPCRAVPCSGLLGEAAEAASSSFAAAAALDAGLGLLGCEVGRRAHRGRVCVRVYACVCVVCARARRCAGGSAPPRRGSMIALSSRCACAVSRSV